jgi:hypothetical protein
MSYTFATIFVRRFYAFQISPPAFGIPYLLPYSLPTGGNTNLECDTSQIHILGIGNGESGD